MSKQHLSMCEKNGKSFEGTYHLHRPYKDTSGKIQLHSAIFVSICGYLRAKYTP